MIDPSNVITDGPAKTNQDVLLPDGNILDAGAKIDELESNGDGTFTGVCYAEQTHVDLDFTEIQWPQVGRL